MEHRIVHEPDHAVLALSGAVSLASVPVLRTTLAKLLLDRGRVVVDLAGSEVTWGPGVDVFPATLWFVGGWPAARMVLCGAEPAMARALRVGGVTSAVPLVADADAARAALDRRPVRVRRSAGMPAAPASLAWARSTVRHACADWELEPEVRDAAVLVATELVTNAVVHAGTPSVLSIGLDGSGLHVAVRDEARGSVATTPTAGIDGGHGLRVVAGLSRCWGVDEHRDGKTVWAVLGLRSPSGPPPCGGSRRPPRPR
jgi:hypothetical protein